VLSSEIYEARRERRKIRNFVGKLFEKRPLRRLEDNIKQDLGI
jgi:hypothetical protein